MTKRGREDSLSSSTSPPLCLDDNSARSLSSSIEAHTPKYVHLESESPTMVPPTSMTCHLPPHAPLRFPNYPSYEAHYHASHTNRCTTCRANFPSAHFLALHIAEQHDPLAALRRGRGEKGYACFVEGCDKVCSEWKKRRSHLVDGHGFPRNYDFFIVDTGVDGRRSMLRAGVDAKGHRRSSREGRPGSETSESTAHTEKEDARKSTDGEPDDGDNEEDNARNCAVAVNQTPEMERLITSISSLSMVPRSVTFGKRKGRAGFAAS